MNKFKTSADTRRKSQVLSHKCESCDNTFHFAFLVNSFKKEAGKLVSKIQCESCESNPTRLYTVSE